MVYIPPILGVLGDGLLLFYPHYVLWLVFLDAEWWSLLCWALNGRTACCRFSMLGHHGVPRHTRDFDKVLQRMEEENIPQSSVAGCFGGLGHLKSVLSVTQTGSLRKNLKKGAQNEQITDQCQPVSIWGDHLCYHEHVQRDQRLATGGVDSPGAVNGLFKNSSGEVRLYAYILIHALCCVTLHYIILYMFNYITLRYIHKSYIHSIALNT